MGRVTMPCHPMVAAALTYPLARAGASRVWVSIALLLWLTPRQDPSSASVGPAVCTAAVLGIRRTDLVWPPSPASWNNAENPSGGDTKSVNATTRELSTTEPSLITGHLLKGIIQGASPNVDTGQIKLGSKLHEDILRLKQGNWTEESAVPDELKKIFRLIWPEKSKDTPLDYASPEEFVGNLTDYFFPADFYDQILAHSAFKMRDELFLYVSPIFIVLGNLSNIVTLLVLNRKKFRHSSVSFYLKAYAVGNLCCINFIMAVTWVCFYLNKQYVTLLADWTCRLWTFLSNVMTFCGIWFVVIMNIDRLIYLTSKQKAKTYCTTFAAKTIVTFVVIGLIVVSIHAMWTFALQPQGCFVPYQEHDLHIMIWPWWSAAVYSYIPLSLLLILNIAQAASICLRWGQSVPCESCLSSSICHSESNVPDSEASHCMKCIKCVRSPPSSPDSGYTKDDYVVTVMVVSVMLFLLTVPATVINILDIHMPSSALNVDVVARIELTKKIVELMSGINRSILGFILLACSRDFRDEFLVILKGMFCCISSNRMLTVFGMRNMISNSNDSSPRIQVDYELCNHNEEIAVTEV